MHVRGVPLQREPRVSRRQYRGAVKRQQEGGDIGRNLLPYFQAQKQVIIF